MLFSTVFASELCYLRKYVVLMAMFALSIYLPLRKISFFYENDSKPILITKIYWELPGTPHDQAGINKIFSWVLLLLFVCFNEKLDVDIEYIALIISFSNVSGSMKEANLAI